MTNRRPRYVTDTTIREDVDHAHDDAIPAAGARWAERRVAENSERAKYRCGRPSLTGSAAVSPGINFRQTPNIRDRALAIAEREGKAISQLAREAFEARVTVS